MTEMTDQEKSVVLARLCGWLVTDEYFHSYHPPNGKGASVNHTKGYTAAQLFDKPLCMTLYAPANMSLAWRVLNWALSHNKDAGDEFENLWVYPFGDEIFAFMYAIAQSGSGRSVLELPPADAQRAWLDKIIKLATEAGMVTK